MLPYPRSPASGACETTPEVQPSALVCCNSSATILIATINQSCEATYFQNNLWITLMTSSFFTGTSNCCFQMQCCQWGQRCGLLLLSLQSNHYDRLHPRRPQTLGDRHEPPACREVRPRSGSHLLHLCTSFYCWLVFDTQRVGSVKSQTPGRCCLESVTWNNCWNDRCKRCVDSWLIYSNYILTAWLSYPHTVCLMVSLQSVCVCLGSADSCCVEFRLASCGQDSLLKIWTLTQREGAGRPSPMQESEADTSEMPPTVLTLESLHGIEFYYCQK